MSKNEFFKMIANIHGLTDEQQEALFARLADRKNLKGEVAFSQELGIGLPTFKKRMTAVYEKFAETWPDLKEGGRGKFEKLRACLEQKYAEWVETGKLNLPDKGVKEEDRPRRIKPDEALDSVHQRPVYTPPEHGLASKPFGKKGCITDPKDFFGREELLYRLFEYLAKGGNCSLVGESEIGKSSILSMVCQWGSQRLGLPAEAFRYLDMQIIHNEDQFFQALCDLLGLETCRGYQLARALRGKRYILCIDEIEKMTRQEKFTGDEQSELRGLADGTDAPLTLIIASRSPLNALFPDSDSMTSPLHNICRQLDVGPFSEKEARAFLKDRLGGTGVTFTESQINELLAETKCHPAHLQQKAASLYNRLTHTEII